MKSLLHYTAAGAVALSLSAAVATAGVPSRSEARQAAKQLEQSRKTLADIIKTAEQKTGGRAVAVSLEDAPIDRSRTSGDANAGGENSDPSKGAGMSDRSGQESRNDASARSNNDGSYGKAQNLEYRVTCLVDDNKLKDAYVCARTGEVKTVRNANEHSRWTRRGRGHDGINRNQMRDGSRSAGNRTDLNHDRYGAGADRFSAGPDGYYEQIVVWHFVPNDGQSDGTYERTAHVNEDGTPIRTQYDPNAQNHHKAQFDDRIARNSNDRNQMGQNDNNQGRSNINVQNANQTGQMVLGSKLLSASATNSQGQDLGDVDDVVINPDNGEVVYTAVSYGGVLGIGEKRFAVPCDASTRVLDDKVYLDIDKSRFENNPGFENKQWPKQADAQLANADSRQRATNAPAQIKKLSEVMGKELKTQQGESLGTIDDAVIDAGAGQIAYLIVDCDAKDGKVAVPCGAIQMQNDKCVVNMTKSRFEQLQTFKGEDYPAWTNASWNERTYSEFNVQPYWKSQAKADATPNSRIAG